MADTYKKISDFSEAAAFNDTDLLLVSQSGTTRVIKGSTLKAFAEAAGVDAAKITNAAVNTSGHLILTTTDGTSIDAGKVTGSDGVSVTGASINAQYHLILTFSDGSTKDAGYCRGASGAGTGDMLKSEYDTDGSVKDAGGILAYLEGNYIPASMRNVANGVAGLDTLGFVPAAKVFNTVYNVSVTADFGYTQTSAVGKAYIYGEIAVVTIRLNGATTSGGFHISANLNGLPAGVTQMSHMSAIGDLTIDSTGKHAIVDLANLHATSNKYFSATLLESNPSLPSGSTFTLQFTFVYYLA